MLQEAFNTHTKSYRGKHIIIPLEVIPLPSLDNLKQTFTPWLQEKLQVITEEQANASSNSQKSSKSTTLKNVESQTYLLMKDQSVHIFPTSENKETQTDIFQQKHKSIQCTSSLETKDVKVQVEIKTKMRGVQCNLDSGSTKTVSNQILTNKDIQCTDNAEIMAKIDESSQCHLQTDNMEKGCQCQVVKKEYNTICTQTVNWCINGIHKSPKLNKSSGIFKHTRRKISTYNNLREKKLKTLVSTMDAKLQFLAGTGLTSNKKTKCNLFHGNYDDEEIQCKYGLHKSNVQLVNTNTECDITKDCDINVSSVSTQITVETDECGLQTDSFISSLVDEAVQTDLFIRQSNIDVKNMLLNTKNELKNEIFSPLPSPAKSLDISTEVSCKNESSSPILKSPRAANCFSPNLLQATKKVNFVKICSECDFLLYSKAEAKEHRKIHVKCKLCKKSFRSIKQMKEHFQTQCDAKLRTLIPMVTITRMDLSTVASLVDKSHHHCTSNMNSISISQCLTPPGKKMKLK